MQTGGKRIAVVLATVALLAIVAVPSFAEHHDSPYQVSANPKEIHMGQSTKITVTLKEAIPSCAFAATISVTGPGGVSAKDTITVNTNKDGNGHGSATFPSGFTGTANTNTHGTYHVSVSLHCQYTYVTNAASTTFVVNKHHDDDDHRGHELTQSLEK